MNRRQKIIISVTGIFIVLLILIGLTYAYFLTRITGNSNPISISVTTANLELVYGDGTTSILTSSTPIEPGKFSSSKDFTVTNTGNTLTDYAVTLEDFAINYANDTVIDGVSITAGTVTKMEYPDDMKMEITCVIESDDEDRNGQACGNINGTLPTENSILLTNSVEVGDTHKYVLTLTYVDSGIDQSKDMNKTIRGKIDIIDPKSTIDLTGTVASYQAGDYAEINSTPIKSEIVDGKYKIIGVEPGSHTLYIKYKDANGDIGTRGSQTLVIKKAEEASVIENTITFTDASREATVDVNSDYTITVDETLKKLNYTLSETILLSSKEAKETNDATRTLYNDTFNLNAIRTISTETDRMLALAEDDYGTSYVFRGTVKDNYVKFAGFTWRIVRINGDETVRLILEGTLEKIKRDGLDIYAGSLSSFYSDEYANAYLGFMHGLAGTTTDANRCLKLVDGTVTDKVSDYTTQETCEQNGGKWTTTAYEATHANVESSDIKKELDIFYETYIENNASNYHYEKYLADSILCGDKTLAKSSIGSSNTALGYGKNVTFYAGVERLRYSSGTTAIVTAVPTLKCAENSPNSFSRYTKDVQNINGIITNGDLKHPIGLLTADELVMVGNLYQKKNQAYYLYDSYKNGNSNPQWWTMTPQQYERGGGSIFRELAGNGLYPFSIQHEAGIRPVINLKADLLVKSGDGTENSPYELKEID